MRDFSAAIFKRLLNEFRSAGYEFVTFEEYLTSPENRGKTIILRHDVDKKPERSLKIAKIENEMGIKGTYYFRVKKNKIAGEEIKKISTLGHKIGYHYDDLNAAKGNVDKALISFQQNLTRLRELALVTTACMHGSPLSKYDNRGLWKDKSYRDFGVEGEPYFDTDFSEVLYLTETGRRWNGSGSSVRDKVTSQGSLSLGFNFMSTSDIIKAVQSGVFPKKALITLHPQRWSDNPMPWLTELIWQKIKNGIKTIRVNMMKKNQKDANGE